MVLRVANAARILLPLPLDQPYDYLLPEGEVLVPGDFVRVPIGPREATGVVWAEAASTVPANKLRTVTARLDAPPLPAETRTFIEWVAAYTLAPLGTVLKLAMSVPAALVAPKPHTRYALSGSIPARMTDARRRVLDIAANGPPMTAADLARAAMVSNSVIRALADAGILLSAALPPAPPFAVPDSELAAVALSPMQSEVAAALSAKVAARVFSVTLLDGVTGSGKTEVYMDAVAEALRQRRQSLVLVPEIALTRQWLERFRRRFGVSPAEWHSELSASQRRVTWRAIADGTARVVVGARSALFLPYPALGLLVIDEEHDASYKQEEGIIYNARDMAVVRARIGAVPAVLVSATPSLETVANVQTGRYERLHLADRHGSAGLPAIEVIDLRTEVLERGRWLAAPVVEAVAAALGARKQALLFLNRRGYAPLTLCRACGYRIQCPNCQAWLVEHRLVRRLECHHCGHTVPRPPACPMCEVKDSLVACGPGVERLAEEARGHFEDARIALMASDTLTGPTAAGELVRAMTEREIDILIGTQVVAKGHHFPYLTVVAVVDADLGLTGGDLRAAERTYQLLNQVAGRSGRAEHSGKVFVQTHAPDHPVMVALQSGDRDAFYASQAADRKARGLPPFGRLAALVVSGKDAALVDTHARALARTAPRARGVEVLGPAPAPLTLLRGRTRYRLLVKSARDVNMQDYVRGWLERVRQPSRIRLQVDIDPMSFL